jgi:EAL domain-containing protein (putative c-di-GMP-specific phosphodiesterase class I)
MGVRLAIDDFGTGYSSLSYLKDFRVNKLKIDRSFVADLAADAGAAAITTAIIAMARALKLQTIAEGVENEAQVAFLRDHGCHAIQEYYCCRPVALADMRALLDAMDGRTCSTQLSKSINQHKQLPVDIPLGLVLAEGSALHRFDS